MNYNDCIRNMRLERQAFINPVDEEDYDTLFQMMSPVPTIYWCEPGSPPTLPLHTEFDDYMYNNKRRANRDIIKGRFAGGTIAYIDKKDIELYACLYKKEIKSFSYIQEQILRLLRYEGPMNIGLIKEITGLLVKDITPALHKLQEAFIVFEDQTDNEGDRAWYIFEDEFSDVDLNKYTKTDALMLALARFAELNVFFTKQMVKSYYKLPLKLINDAIEQMVLEKILIELTVDDVDGFILAKDENIISNNTILKERSIKLLHRNDFMVRSNGDELKDKYHSEWDTLYYILIDNEIKGAVVGKFKFGPHIIEDVIVDLDEDEKAKRKQEIIRAVYNIFNINTSPIKRYCGKEQ